MMTSSLAMSLSSLITVTLLHIVSGNENEKLVISGESITDSIGKVEQLGRGFVVSTSQESEVALYYYLGFLIMGILGGAVALLIPCAKTKTIICKRVVMEAQRCVEANNIAIADDDNGNATVETTTQEERMKKKSLTSSSTTTKTTIDCNQPNSGKYIYEYQNGDKMVTAQVYFDFVKSSNGWKISGTGSDPDGAFDIKHGGLSHDGMIYWEAFQEKTSRRIVCYGKLSLDACKNMLGSRGQQWATNNNDTNNNERGSSLSSLCFQEPTATPPLAIDSDNDSFSNGSSSNEDGDDVEKQKWQ